ncbi:hypothetical protein CR513_26332, partial [Mucuna pruriens]
MIAIKLCLPEFSPTLNEESIVKWISLETVITRQLVLQYMLQSRIPYLHKHPTGHHQYDYFLFSGNHVTNKCGFRATECSITIPYLPISHACRFIYCNIFLKGSLSGSVSIYQDDIVLEHVYISNIKYNRDVDEERIKGCGAFPVYATTSGFKMFKSSSKDFSE